MGGKQVKPKQTRSGEQEPAPLHVRPPGGAFPSWLRDGLALPSGDPLPASGQGFLAAILIGQATPTGWFTALELEGRSALLHELLRTVEAAAPGTPKFLVTPAGFLEQPWDSLSHSTAAEDLASALGPRTVVQLGVDSPWDRGPATEQSVIPVTRGGASHPRWKVYPAPAGRDWEPVPHAGRTYAFVQRSYPTPFGTAWPAVCHDLFAIDGVARDYGTRTGLSTPTRVQLQRELPRAGPRSTALIANSVHRFRSRAIGGGHFGRFPGRTTAAADASGAATLTAALFDGFETTTWAAGRARGTAAIVEADAHWWVDGPHPADWLWLQVFLPSTLGLPAPAPTVP